MAGNQKAGLTQHVCTRAKYEGDGTQWCIIWDDKVPGMGLRIYPGGRKSFVLFYRPQGERRKRLYTVGKFGVLTLAQARKKAKAVAVGIADGVDPLDQKALAPKATVRELAEKWMEDYAKLHRRRWDEAQYHIDRHILPALGTRTAAKVAHAHVRALHADIGRTAPVQANRVIETLRAIFNKARSWGLLPHGHPNPAAGIERFKEKSRERWLAPREVLRLAAAINREDDVWVQAAFRLLLLTGCRKGELLRARWDRLDLDGRRLLLEETKTGEPKVVPLSDPALDVLRDLPRDIKSPWVFPSPKNRKQHLRDLKRPWERIRKRAKLPNARIHDLRRTAGSWMVQQGVPLKVVGAALGHKDDRATAVYARIAATQPADALNLLGEAMAGAVRPRNDRRRA